MKSSSTFLGLVLVLFLCLTFFALVPSGALGTIPQLINFQGILKDGSGNPVTNGSYSVTFTIYDAPSGGTNLWQEVQTVNTTNGLFTVLLGSGALPLYYYLFNDSTRWLGVKVGTDPEMTPRQRLVSGAYSLRVAHFIPDFGGGNTFIGQNAGNQTMSGCCNTASGVLALASNTTGGFNTASGRGALSNNTTGDYNTASGHYALNRNTTGFYNTASGADALTFNTGGNYNTANGYQALQNNTTGSQNTASGLSALQSNTTGLNNTASGYLALRNNTSGSGNTASGAFALDANIANDQNTAVGYRALRNTTASNYNTAVGANAGTTFDNGFNNVFLGANVDVNQANLFNVIAIGQATVVGSSSTARFGNSATVSYGGWADWTNVSDGRYKKNVRENVPGIEFIKKLRPITYNLDATGLDAFYRKNEEVEMPLAASAKAVHERALREKEQIVQTGFVAQEVEAAARTLGFDFSGVDAAKNGNDVYGLRYAEFVVPLVKAVQELGEENERMKKELNGLRELLQGLLAKEGASTPTYTQNDGQKGGSK